MVWDTLRKTYIIVNVAFGHRNAKVFAEQIRVRIDRHFDISIDPNKNFRTRNKGSGTCLAATALSRDVSALKTVQIFDRAVIQDMERYLEASENVPDTCRLHVALQGDYWFEAHTELKGQGNLFLHVKPIKGATRRA